MILKEMDIGDKLYSELLAVVYKLMFLNLEKDTPGCDLLREVATAVEKYEDHFFKWEDE